jgi:hypothetical protein
MLSFHNLPARPAAIRRLAGSMEHWAASDRLDGALSRPGFGLRLGEPKT